MRRDTCTTCGGAFKTDRDGLWSGDKREHRCESTCVKHLKERLAAAEAAARWLYRWVNDSQWEHFTPEDLTYLEQYPWLADEAKGGWE